MIFKLAQSAEKRWRKLQGYKLLVEVITGIRFTDGIRDTDAAGSKVA